MTKITVNGRSYDSVEQMPPEVREEYLQALAALREAEVSETTPGSMHKDVVSRSVVRESFVFNGREYQSREELPPEARALVEQMPPPSAADQTTNVEIKTVRTLRPEVRITGRFADERDQPAEGKPAMAWLLVKILVVVVLILLALLFWLGIRPKG